MDRKAVFDFLENEKPDAVVVAAAKVGGIQANTSFPVEFLSHNIQIDSNLLDAAHAANVERLLYLGSSCAYPRLSSQPMKEEYLFTGELEKTNESYALAKISGIKLVQAYRRQYGRSWIAAMPTNIYGPNDRFDLENSHVLPALIKRFHEGKRKSSPSVTLWGTGSPRREFLHSDDLGRACILLLERYNEDVAINVGYGEDISIKELSYLIKEATGFLGEINWDTSKSDGAPRKLLDISRIQSIGWTPEMELSLGIRETYEWYSSQDAVNVPKH
jgi:GDP-L-fucose synthase